ncbi:hypothetical protein ACFQX8_02225 [Klenkia terrae]|uniref:hypothetical protein n=1 Tax=Klenkia terrae TaxID=1052259 RepID=UPI0036202447
MPQSGRLEDLHVPADAEFRLPHGPGIRLDSGVAPGSEVGVHYDPMLAKVIAWAPDRTSAALALAGALERARLHGLTTNRDLLVRVLRSGAFLAGETDTGFLDRHGLDVLAAPWWTPNGCDCTRSRPPSRGGAAAGHRAGARRPAVGVAQQPDAGADHCLRRRDRAVPPR